MEKVRVSKLMSERGLCSRREADVYIERGWVFVDGVRITELGTRIDPASDITLNKAAQASQRARVTILLNKPVGYVSAQAEPGYRPAVSLINAESRFSGDRSTERFTPMHLKGLAPAGRLEALAGRSPSGADAAVVALDDAVDRCAASLLDHGDATMGALRACAGPLAATPPSRRH